MPFIKVVHHIVWVDDFSRRLRIYIFCSILILIFDVFIRPHNFMRSSNNWLITRDSHSSFLIDLIDIIGNRRRHILFGHFFVIILRLKLPYWLGLLKCSNFWSLRWRAISIWTVYPRAFFIIVLIFRLIFNHLSWRIVDWLLNSLFLRRLYG